jgi:hypothetical protein
MAPERVEERVLHGQRVLVKVYPKQPSADGSPWAIYGEGWSAGSGGSVSIDETALEEPMSDATRRALAKPSPSPHIKAS